MKALVITAALQILTANAATAPWREATITPSELTVGSKNELEWSLRLPNGQQLLPRDCIEFEVSAPQASASGYQSFNPNEFKDEAPKCDFFEGPLQASCAVMSPQILRVTYSHPESTASAFIGARIRGRTNNKVFNNPASAHGDSNVKITFYPECNVAKPSVLSVAQLTAFQNGVILRDMIKFDTDSNIVAKQDAILNISFRPASSFQKKGSIRIKVPSWYDLSIDRASSESMLTKDSVPTFLKPSDCTIEKHNWEGPNRIFEIFYECPKKIGQRTWGYSIELQITKFKTPVNQYTRTGFSIVTTDEHNHVVDKSRDDQALIQNMQVLGKFATTEIQLNGDAEKKNAGRISLYNSVTLFFTSKIPFQQKCYVQIQFPKQLKIEKSQMLFVKGTGFFTPKRDIGSGEMNTGDYVVDTLGNSVVVNACMQIKNLITEPTGSLTFYYIKLPDYIQDTGYFKIDIYSDIKRAMPIISSHDQLRLEKKQLAPGLLNLQKFQPSNSYAWTPNVSYTIWFTPSHDLKKDARVVLTMPTNLFFDVKKPCSVNIQGAKCKVEIKRQGFSSQGQFLTTRLEITNLFKKEFAGGEMIKMTVGLGRNPTGAMQAGPYAVTTEQPIGNTYYAIDSETSQTSFLALSGTIKSALTVTSSASTDGSQKTTFESATYNLEISPEHGIQKGGFIEVSLPKGLIFLKDEVFAPKGDALQSTKLKLWDASSNDRILVSVLEAHTVEDNPIMFSLLNIRNPRSYQPSKGFSIVTRDKNKIPVDIGGQDINLVMNNMNIFEEFKIQPSDATNGVVNMYQVDFTSKVFIFKNDILNIEFPLTVQLTENIRCITPEEQAGAPLADKPLISSIQCNANRQILQVHINGLDKEIGKFQFFIEGVKNPPSLKQSAPFVQIFMTTDTFYNIQQVSDSNLKSIRIKNTKVAVVEDYKQVQTYEDYGKTASYTIEFKPKNEIPNLGAISVHLSDQVTLQQESQCIVTTYKKFEDNKVCKRVEDINGKTVIVIDGAFIDQVQYKGTISIQLTQVVNPRKNNPLDNIEIKTFERNGTFPQKAFEPTKDYAIDQLFFKPSLECNYPCQNCGQTKDYCTSCWKDDTKNFLMVLPQSQTCKNKCDPGYSTNGNLDKKCQQCADSCATCLDNGKKDDLQRCLTCSPGFEFTIPVKPLSHLGSVAPTKKFDYQKCNIECPSGYYFIDGTKLCLPCHGSCKTCSGPLESQCLSCYPRVSPANPKALPVRLESKCVKECPKGFTEIGGVCKKCESPCEECSTGPQACTKCDVSTGMGLLYGPTCLAKCPEGTLKNEAEQTCEGCLKGCLDCDPTNEAICLRCDSKLLIHEGQCITRCPQGFMATFEADKCISMDSIDMKIMYFPFLIMAAILMIFSVIAYKIKSRHRFMTNFILMMGALEFFCTMTQIFLTFKFGTFRYAIVVILIFVFYVAINITFFVMFMRRIKKGDAKFKEHRDVRSQHRTAALATECMSLVFSWRFIKLFYSHFLGTRIKAAEFTNPWEYERSQKWAMFGSFGFYYLPMFVLCLIGLVDLKWGTQLYIIMIENIIFAVLMPLLLFFEQRLIRQYMKEDTYFKINKETGMKFMSGLQEDFPEKDKMLNKLKDQPEFLNYKLEELMTKFGHRLCRSCVEFDNEKVNDPRLCRSLIYEDADLPDNFKVDDPPKPLKFDPYPDNVKAVGLSPRHFNHFEPPFANCVNKGIQVGGEFAGDMCRIDAGIISKAQEPMARVFEEDDFEHTKGQTASKNKRDKKRRGRKNRFFQQIDNEDNDAGVLLDSDSEGDKANETAKQSMLQQASRLDAIREEDEDRERARLDALMREQQEAERKAAQEAEQARIRSEREASEEQDRQQEFQRKLAEKKAQEDAEAARLQKIKDDELAAKEAAKQAELLRIARENAGPSADLRNFNEIDIVGEVERDDKGTLIIEFDQNGAQEAHYDLKGQPISSKGYRIDVNSGNIIHNSKQTKMFEARSIDDRGNLPAPFNIERFNFNPFDLQGTFVFTDKDDPNSFQKAFKAGRFLDQFGRQVTMQGFLMDNQGSLINKDGVKRFDYLQFAQFGGAMPKLYNYEGKRFDIHDVMGVFERDEDNRLKFIRQKDAHGREITLDQGGNLVNDRGYIVNEKGDVCSRAGPVLFEASTLRNGEFAKFFPFTRFSIKTVMGDFELDGANMPILDRKPNGDLNDQQGRQVNPKGYTVDKQGNIINAYGQIVFERNLLDNNGEIPELFRANLLKTETESDISQLMNDLEENPPVQEDDEDDAAVDLGRQSAENAKKAAMKAQMAESFDSDVQMQNQQRRKMDSRGGHGVPEDILEEDEYYDEVAGKKKRKGKKKKKKHDQYFVEEITRRDVDMAGAYGGIAKPRIRKVPGGIKLKAVNQREGASSKAEKQRDSTPGPNVRASSQGKPGAPQMGNLFSQGGNNSEHKTTKLAGAEIANNKEAMSQQLQMGGTQGSGGWNSNQHLPPRSSSKQMSESKAIQRKSGNRQSRENKVRSSGDRNYPAGQSAPTDPNNGQLVQFEDEFEKLYKKDIQQFIDESSFEVASLEGLSQISRDSRDANNSKAKNLEKVYLQRVEGMPQERQGQQKGRQKQNFRGEVTGRTGIQSSNYTSNNNMHGVSYNQTPMDLSGIDQPNQLDSQDNLTPQQHVPNPFKDMPGKRGPGDTYYSNN